MPQMSPMDWLMIFIYFFFIYMLVLFMVYYMIYVNIEDELMKGYKVKYYKINW